MSCCEAYICDFCKQLKIADECVGISPQVDAFEVLHSYPTILNPAKALIHYCTNCYNLYVIGPAEVQANRKNDERGYKIKIQELAYMLKSQCVANYNANLKKKNLRSK